MKKINEDIAAGPQSGRRWRRAALAAAAMALPVIGLAIPATAATTASAGVHQVAAGGWGPPLPPPNVGGNCHGHCKELAPLS